MPHPAPRAEDVAARGANKDGLKQRATDKRSTGTKGVPASRVPALAQPLRSSLPPRRVWSAEAKSLPRRLYASQTSSGLVPFAGSRAIGPTKASEAYPDLRLGEGGIPPERSRRGRTEKKLIGLGPRDTSRHRQPRRRRQTWMTPIPLYDGQMPRFALRRGLGPRTGTLPRGRCVEEGRPRRARTACVLHDQGRRRRPQSRIIQKRRVGVCIQ